MIILDQPVWRWFGVVVVLFIATGLFLLIRRAAAAWAGRDSGSALRIQRSRLASAVTLLLLISIVIRVLADNLRLSGHVLEVASLSLWALFTLTLTWAVWLGSHILAESVVSSQQMLAGSIDSQLIRLGLRLVATILSIAILVVGCPASRHSGLLGHCRTGCGWYSSRPGGQRQPRQPARLTADHVRKTVPCWSLDKG